MSEPATFDFTCASCGASLDVLNYRRVLCHVQTLDPAKKEPDRYLNYCPKCYERLYGSPLDVRIPEGNLGDAVNDLFFPPLDGRGDSNG